MYTVYPRSDYVVLVVSAFAKEIALAERELDLIGMIQSKSFKNSKDRKDVNLTY